MVIHAMYAVLVAYFRQEIFGVDLVNQSIKPNEEIWHPYKRKSQGSLYCH